MFSVLCFKRLTFKFCVLCSVLLSAMETLKEKDINGDVSILVRLSFFYLLSFLSACPHWDIVFCVRMFRVLCFKLLTFKFWRLCFVPCVVKRRDGDIKRKR